MTRARVRFRAAVASATGDVRHRHAVVTPDGAIVPRDAIAAPAYVEISEGDGGFHLNRFDAAGQLLTDTWHATLEDAQRQAAFELVLDSRGWMAADD